MKSMKWRMMSEPLCLETKKKKTEYFQCSGMFKNSDKILDNFDQVFLVTNSIVGLPLVGPSNDFRTFFVPWICRWICTNGSVTHFVPVLLRKNIEFSVGRLCVPNDAKYLIYAAAEIQFRRKLIHHVKLAYTVLRVVALPIQCGYSVHLLATSKKTLTMQMRNEQIMVIIPERRVL